MSVTWQMYADFIKAKGNVDECMIVDAEDCNHWASTAEFMVSILIGLRLLLLLKKGK